MPGKVFVSYSSKDVELFALVTEHLDVLELDVWADTRIPAGVDWSHGTLHALLYDPFLVHFIHRWWAWGAAVALILLARQARRAGQRAPSIAINAAVGTQIVLGIATVLSGIALPLAVLARPGYSLRALGGPAATRFSWDIFLLAGPAAEASFRWTGARPAGCRRTPCARSGPAGAGARAPAHG